MGKKHTPTPSKAFPELLARLGLVPPDTPLNRRCAAYAGDAQRVVNNRKELARYYKRKASRTTK